MNKQELMEKVKALMENEAFKAKLEASNDLDEMATAFQVEGINITGADLDVIAAKIQDNVELTEDSLDEVAGGFGIGAIATLAIIGFVGGSLLLGYIDGVRNKAASCRAR